MRSPSCWSRPGAPPTRLAIARESLEDHFIRLTGARRRGGIVSALRAAVGTEMLKARHSRVPWGVAIGFSIAPLVMGLFMVILKDPERARSLGLLGAKAQLTAGTADWPTFLEHARPGGRRRRGDPVRLPHGVGLRARVRRPDRAGPAREPDATADDRPRQGVRDRDLGPRDLGLGPRARARRSGRSSICPAGPRPTPARPWRRSRSPPS